MPTGSSQEATDLDGLVWVVSPASSSAPLPWTVWAGGEVVAILAELPAWILLEAKGSADAAEIIRLQTVLKNMRQIEQLHLDIQAQYTTPDLLHD